MNAITTHQVAGMACEGCVRAITNAIRQVKPSAFVQVDLLSGTVTLDGSLGEDVVRQAVEKAGFEYRGAVVAR